MNIAGSGPSFSDDSRLPSTFPRLLRYIGNDIDFNWLWTRRKDEMYRTEIQKFFFSPRFSADVRRVLSPENKMQIIQTRRFIKIVYNSRRKKKQRLLREVLHDPLIRDVIGIVLDYD